MSIYKIKKLKNFKHCQLFFITINFVQNFSTYFFFKWLTLPLRPHGPLKAACSNMWPIAGGWVHWSSASPPTPPSPPPARPHHCTAVSGAQLHRLRSFAASPMPPLCRSTPAASPLQWRPPALPRHIRPPLLPDHRSSRHYFISFK